MTSRMISSWDSWVCNNNWVNWVSTSAAERLPIFFLFDDNFDNIPLESIPLERLGLSATTKMQPVECSGFEPRWKRIPVLKAPCPVGAEILLISSCSLHSLLVLRNPLPPLLVSESRYSCAESEVNTGGTRGTFCTIGSRRLNFGEWVTVMW